MKTIRLTLISCSLLFSLSTFAEHTRVTNPNAFSIEAFGRGILYGITFDRVINDDLSAGVSFGTVGTKTLADVDTSFTATMIPVFVNYYFTRDQGSVYVTGGATLVANNGDVKGLKSAMGNIEFGSTGVHATFGAGYENRSDNGFLFRFTGYGIYAKKLSPWFGFTFGFAF